MIRILSVVAIVVVLLSSCARALTPSEAASGSYKKCRAIR